MRWIGLSLLLAVAACSDPDGTTGGGNAGMPAETGAWVTLFDGSSLDAFEPVGDANWEIVDGTVRADDGNGMLVTQQSYGDFEFEVEFWVDEPANSGVFIRCQDRLEPGAANCYEVNIYDTRPDQTYRTGAIVDVASPLRIMHAAGRWNRFRISAVGSHLVVEFNGETTVDAEDDRFSEGPIALQRGAGVVIFRNARIRAL